MWRSRSMQCMPHTQLAIAQDDADDANSSSTNLVPSCATRPVSTASRPSSGNSRHRRSLPQLPTSILSAEIEMRRVKAQPLPQSDGRTHKGETDAQNDSDESEFVNEVKLDSRGPTPLRNDESCHTPESHLMLTDYDEDYGSRSSLYIDMYNKEPIYHNFHHKSRHSVETVSSRGNRSTQSPPSSQSSESRGLECQYDFSQLAQWGVMPPEDGATEIHRPKPVPATGKFEMEVEHPSLYTILATCSLHPFHVPRGFRKGRSAFGLSIFESVFTDVGSERGRTRHKKKAIFRSPSGRRPILSRHKGAFQPVSRCAEETLVSSLIAIDAIDKDGPAATAGLLEGDYIVEVSGMSVLEKTPREVLDVICAAQDLHLVVARVRDHRGSAASLAMESKSVSSKDFAKLQLKYSALKAESERASDVIAELKLEVQDLEVRSHELEEELRLQEDGTANLQEAEDCRWQVGQLKNELARMHSESKKKDERLIKLRQLLIQQSELKQSHKNGGQDGKSGFLKSAERHRPEGQIEPEACAERQTSGERLRQHVAPVRQTSVERQRQHVTPEGRDKRRTRRTDEASIK